MVDVTLQVEWLGRGSAAREWCSHPEACQDFWPGSGDWKGLRAVCDARPQPDHTKRELVSEAMARQYAAAGLELPEAAWSSFRGGAAVVTVGHQLQAGGGPAYFHYKILSALRWSRRLRAAGTPAVAVFWMASEDHDFEEVSRTMGAGGDAFVWQADDPMRDEAVGRKVWTPKAEQAWRDWCERQGLAQPPGPSLEASESISLGQRMRHWLAAWFPEEDLLILDGDDARLKECAQKLWQAEWLGTGIGPALEAQSSAYSARWGSAPLHPRSNNVFVLDESGLRMRADRWLAQREEEGPFDPSQIPLHHNSPNAALRPLYQEFLLESVAFVGGPSEVAYWMMLGKAFQHHGIRQPALLMRDGAFVWGTHGADWANRVGWSPADGGLTGPEAETLLAERALENLGQPARAFEALSNALVDYAEGIPGDAVPTTRAALARMEKEFVNVRKKWRKIWKQTHRLECEEIAAAFEHWLSPHGQPQERVLNALVLAESCRGWEAFREAWFESLENVDEPAFLVYQSSKG